MMPSNTSYPSGSFHPVARTEFPETFNMRTDYCGNIDTRHLDTSITLCGWVHRRRDHGGVIFIDLRDREGLVQIVCNPEQAEVFAAAEHVRNEFCLRVTGVV